jgi:hypothetical protein
VNIIQFKFKIKNNMENVVWDAVPAQRTRKQEKYSTPVVTMSAIDKPGAGRKFSFNKAAQDALGIVGEDRIAFGFQADGNKIFVRKESNPEAGFQLTKTCTLSDKKTYEFIVKRWNLNSEVETELDLIMGESFGELVIKDSITKVTPVAENIAEEIEETTVTVENTDFEEEIEEAVTETSVDNEESDEDVW